MIAKGVTIIKISGRLILSYDSTASKGIPMRKKRMLFLNTITIRQPRIKFILFAP